MKTEYIRKAALTGLWTAFILIVLWMAGIARMHWSQPDLASAILYPPGDRALPDFSLLDSEREVFDRRRLAGGWSFLFFGYARCPDVCPLSLQTLRSARAGIRLNGGSDNLRVVFISVDPARDTPEFLKEYVSYFDPGFLGITGDEAQLAALASAMNAPFRRTGPESARQESYFMDHSAMIYLISPDAELYAMLPPPHMAEVIADDFHRILAHYSKTRMGEASIAGF